MAGGIEMSKSKSLTDNCLVDAFGQNVRDYRRDCNSTAEKSLTLTFVLVTLLFLAVLTRFLIS